MPMNNIESKADIAIKRLNQAIKFLRKEIKKAKVAINKRSVINGR